MVIGDLMMTWHVVMEEYPCTMDIRNLEAQRLPQLAHYAKMLPLRGLTSYFWAYLFCKFKLYFVKREIKEVGLSIVSLL
jgi:hypothetical protein